MQQTTQAYLIIHLGNRWTDILKLQPSQTVFVGRSSECQIVVRDERASRKHARVYPHNGGWAVEDLGSRNGTQVAGDSIDGAHVLSDGETIQVGGCRITFSLDVGNGVAAAARSPGEIPSVHSQNTAKVEPTIVNRMANSQWSSDSVSLETVLDSAGREGAKANRSHRSSSPTDPDGPWSFFYRLVFDLVTCQTAEAAAQVALDRLLERLGLGAGGVLSLESNDDDREKNGADSPMAVLAARQQEGGSYHRLSDFLAQSVIADRQAVLARNVQDDSKLSVARASGQREVVSVIVAPLRYRHGDQERLLGMLHIYSAGDERMLTDADLELAVGVADNLSIALTRQSENAELTRSLERTRRRVEQLEEQLDQSIVMVGNSPALMQVKQSIERAGPTNATVLVRGESGVGKELVARAIHGASNRRDGPLVCMNCAALAPTLLESELFGHEKGAFTGATDRKIGKFEAAHRGTLLLDEIGEMSAELQAKFLRVLEGQPFERLGGNKPIQTDVRVIAATNRALEEAVAEKTFRADLYYRLRVIEMMVPPLRERMDDVPVLVEHFLEQMKQHAGRRLTGVSPEALELLTRHDWPGNVRELRNVIERAVVLGNASTIQPDDLSLSEIGLDVPATADAASAPAFRPIPLAQLEREHIYAMLEHAGGNKSKASQMLGIERSTLDRKLKRYESK